MFVRRLSTFAAASALALAITVPAMAQDDGATVTINLGTCTVTGSADSYVIANDLDPNGVGRDCVDGWPGDASWITVDGASATSSSDTALVWENITDGEHTVNLPATGSTDETEGFAFTIEGEDQVFWATWHQHEIPTDDDTGDDTTTSPTAPAASDSAADDDTTGSGGTSASASTASSLPKTGSGPANTSAGIGIALAAAAGIAAVGARQSRRRA